MKKSRFFKIYPYGDICFTKDAYVHRDGIFEAIYSLAFNYRYKKGRMLNSRKIF